MKLPFGLDLKTFIVAVLFTMYVVPWIMGMFASRKRAEA